jgi:luciferase family oxidoreductase group 1
VKLSVLDQSPIISGHSPAQAIAETIALAKRVEALGYTRYWLAEHHAIAALADPCPEILLARLGAETKTIRIGTGGVLLPYYSAFKVAEVFRMLEALYRGRIDLGIGRAPGGDAKTARAVGGGRFPDADNFPQQVWELAHHLGRGAPRQGHRPAPARDGVQP